MAKKNTTAADDPSRKDIPQPSEQDEQIQNAAGAEQQPDPAGTEETSKAPEQPSEQAPAAPEEASKGKGEKKAPSRYIVVKPFRDRNNWAKEYPAGTDVTGFDKDRLAHLEKIGFVEAR